MPRSETKQKLLSIFMRGWLIAFLFWLALMLTCTVLERTSTYPFKSIFDNFGIRNEGSYLSADGRVFCRCRNYLEDRNALELAGRMGLTIRYEAIKGMLSRKIQRIKSSSMGRNPRSFAKSSWRSLSFRSWILSGMALTSAF